MDSEAGQFGPFPVGNDWKQGLETRTGNKDWKQGLETRTGNKDRKQGLH
jgi:hypothetical protein